MKTYLRIRYLPLEEQEPFRKELIGQTSPEIPGVPDEDQDAYYKIDYDRWKRRLALEQRGIKPYPLDWD